MNSTPLGFGEQAARVPGHICLFHDTYDELRAVVAGFLRPVLSERRQGIVLLGPPGVPRTLQRHLEVDLAVSLEEGIARGTVLLVESERDADAYLERVREAIDALNERGVELVRAFGRSVWNAVDFPLPEDHLWFESHLNTVVAGRRTIMICAYDVSELPGAALTYGGLETHPQIIYGGRLVESPRFLEPDRFLATRLLSLRWLTPETRRAP